MDKTDESIVLRYAAQLMMMAMGMDHSYATMGDYLKLYVKHIREVSDSAWLHDQLALYVSETNPSGKK
jgi:hypothetical protein